MVLMLNLLEFQFYKSHAISYVSLWYKLCALFEENMYRLICENIQYLYDVSYQKGKFVRAVCIQSKIEQGCIDVLLF